MSHQRLGDNRCSWTLATSEDRFAHDKGLTPILSHLNAPSSPLAPAALVPVTGTGLNFIKAVTFPTAAHTVPACCYTYVGVRCADLCRRLAGRGVTALRRNALTRTEDGDVILGLLSPHCCSMEVGASPLHRVAPILSYRRWRSRVKILVHRGLNIIKMSECDVLRALYLCVAVKGRKASWNRESDYYPEKSNTFINARRRFRATDTRRGRQTARRRPDRSSNSVLNMFSNENLIVLSVFTSGAIVTKSLCGFEGMLRSTFDRSDHERE
ncbi:hypothetical protein EVAR_4792_1 [Eumeta japonica]|uniref:Uncharacterized protein n=1 Tax=Eumeta variegata TaxID=151549 RepID=A0A4C1SZR6_EUMVA|nr:hypothetical protein EVAR_4792_1 [Eumeta japonica]